MQDIRSSYCFEKTLSSVSVDGCDHPGFVLLCARTVCFDLLLCTEYIQDTFAKQRLFRTFRLLPTVADGR